MKQDKMIMVLDKETITACMLALLVADMCATDRGENHYSRQYRRAYSKVATEKNRNINLQTV